MGSVDRVWETLDGADRILISSHVQPDGDAIGSELALGFILRGAGRSFRIVNESPIPDLYGFLPGIQWVETWPAAIDDEFDVFVALDCGRRNRLGANIEAIPHRTLVNIDHHVSNDAFGDVNWIESGVSSTGEILVELADRAGIPLGEDLATCLYTAILTDTGNFTFTNTTSRCHAVCARLIECGARPADISRHLYRSKPIGKLRLQARLIQELEVDAKTRLAWGVLTREMCDEAGVGINDTLDLVTIPLSVEGVVLGILFRELEEPGRTKVSFRSEGDLDVSRLAKELGGGGHPTAAGCTLEMGVDKAVELVVPLIRTGLVKRSATTMIRRLRQQTPKKV